MSGYFYQGGYNGPTQKEIEAKERARKKLEREENERWEAAGYPIAYPEKPGGGYKACAEILATDFISLRTLAEDLEETVSVLSPEWSEKDRKRFDKAVVAIKIGAKLIEKVLRRHGFAKAKTKALVKAMGGEG